MTQRESQQQCRGVLGERGATAVEYALLVVLIAGVIITTVGFLGQDVRDLFTAVDWTP